MLSLPAGRQAIAKHLRVNSAKDLWLLDSSAGVYPERSEWGLRMTRII